MTQRAWHLSALICVVIVLGLLTRNGNVLLLALPLIFYLGAAILAVLETIQLKIARSISVNRAAYGKPIRVTLTVENAGTTLEELHLADRVTPALPTVEGQPARSLTLPAGGRVALEYQVHGGRGAYQFEGVKIVTSDHFGLFRAQQMIEAADHLLIYPQIVRLRRIDIRPQRTHGFAGPIPARRAGSGTDFFGVREYQMGDALRKINWRVTARHNQTLFTNEFEQESITDVGVILDARAQSNIRIGQADLFEFGAQAAASLAELFLQEGHRVGLLVYGYGVMRVFPGYGTVQRERILNALAKAETGKSYALESLDRLPTRFFPPRSQLVIVSPMLPDDLPALLRFRSLGYAMLIISPDPIDFEIRSLPSTPGLEAAIRLARIERAVLLGRLRRAGIRVVDWPTDRPLDQVLYASLVRQPLQRPPVQVAR